MANHNRFSAWHPRRMLSVCFSVKFFGRISCSISPQMSSACLHNNEWSFSWISQKSRTDEFMLPSGRSAPSLNKIPVFSRADIAQSFFKQSDGNLSGLSEPDFAQPAKAKTKITDVKIFLMAWRFRLLRQIKRAFFMVPNPFFNRFGWATSVYKKGSIFANSCRWHTAQKAQTCSPA